MPHFIIQYSENLNEQVNMTELCAVMSKTMQQTGLFPLAGIRVRAHPMPHSSIADEHPNNAFADMILRIGGGRSDELLHVGNHSTAAVRAGAGCGLGTSDACKHWDFTCGNRYEG